MMSTFRKNWHEISIPWRGVLGGALLAVTLQAADPVLVSSTGSGRATAYVESPKIITRDGRTHVAWLDSSAEGFRVRVRTLDRASDTWGEPVTIGEAEDNHGGPALTIDEAGYLHVLYYSHHHPFRYRRSLRPNDATAWTPYEEFGHNLTYPSLVVAADGTLIMTARRSYDDRPWELELWRKAPGEAWTRQGPVVRSRFVNYAQFAGALAWSPDHQTLHLGVRLYEMREDDTAWNHTGILHFRSEDDGRTWIDDAGNTLMEAATVETGHPLAVGSIDQNVVLNSGSIDVGPAGEVAVPYSVRRQDSAQCYVAIRKPGESQWRHRWLNRYLPDAWRDAALMMHGGAAYDAAGRLTVLAVLMRMAPDSTAWGEPSMEVVRFVSDDGGASFTGEVVGEPDATMPHWMPNLERRTGFNAVPHGNSFIYTAGVRGAALTDQLSNEVWWVPAAQP